MGNSRNIVLAMILAAAVTTSPALAALVPTTLSGGEPNTEMLYKFDEFTGDGALVTAGAVLDSSSHARNGTHADTRVYPSDLDSSFVETMRLTTSDIRLPGGSLSSSFYEGDFTVEAWVRMDGMIQKTGNVGQIVANQRFFTTRSSSGTIGWICQLETSGTANKLRVHNGSAWADAVVNFTLPTTGWTHWAMVFTNQNAGNSDSSYSVNFYVTDPDVDTAPNLLGTFNLDPVATTSTLAGLDWGFNADPTGNGSFGAGDTAWIDDLRLSSVAETSFAALGQTTIPEPATLALLAFGGLAVGGAGIRRRRH